MLKDLNGKMLKFFLNQERNSLKMVYLKSLKMNMFKWKITLTNL